MVTVTKLLMDIALSHVLPAIIRAVKLSRNDKQLENKSTEKIITELLETKSLYDTEHAKKCFTSFDLHVGAVGLRLLNHHYFRGLIMNARLETHGR